MASVVLRGTGEPSREFLYALTRPVRALDQARLDPAPIALTPRQNVDTLSTPTRYAVHLWNSSMTNAFLDESHPIGVRRFPARGIVERHQLGSALDRDLFREGAREIVLRGESFVAPGPCLLVIRPIFSSILTGDPPGAVATLVGITSLFGGTARYAAVLAGRLEPDVERATAIGFFVGLGIAVLVLAIDALA